MLQIKERLKLKMNPSDHWVNTKCILVLYDRMDE